jgi:hypothetical protein
VQGFTDDPALLFAALGNKKNNEVQSSDMLKGQEETNAQANLIGMMSEGGRRQRSHSTPPAMTAALQDFIEGERHFAGNRPGASDLGESAAAGHVSEWISGAQECDLVFRIAMDRGRVDQQVEEEWEKTQNMLAAARVALYPVDARGVSTIGFYQADSQLPNSISIRRRRCHSRVRRAGDAGKRVARKGNDGSEDQRKQRNSQSSR